MKNEMLSILEGNKTNLSSRQFVGRDLPHPLLLGQEEKQPCFTRDVEDPRQRPSGMTPVFYNDNSMGFTLIELLVVVLIIGILAAVALPQYQKAVERSRAAQALTLLKSISQAAQTYHLANGVWPTKFEELDVEIPWTGNKKWHRFAQDTKSNGEWSAQLYTEDTSSYLMLWIGRISGPYAGTGLAAESSRNFQPMCTEDTTGNNTSSFSLGEGAYCQKVMRGSFLGGNGGMDYYTLP